MLAAQTTGALTGVVTGEGRGLAGVTVTIASPSLQGTRSTTTSESGAYSFAALPPGTYDVTFSTAERPPTHAAVELRLAQTARLDAVLATITVTAPPPSAIETPQISTNLPLKLIERLPLQRNQLATGQFAPGVNPYTLSNGVVSIAGGPGYDNLVLINGVVVTENVRGQMRPMYVEDAIQETTILAGAISAEYGRFTGGVISSITRSGGNELSGSLRDSLSSAAWSAQTPAGETREDTLNHVWEATLGGAALRDRLWFFGAGRWAKNDTARQTLSVPAFATPASAASPGISYAEGNDQKRFEAKLTGRVGEQQTVALSYFSIDTQGTNARFSNNIYDLASLTTRDDPESLVALHYDGVVLPSLLLEGRGSARKFSDRTGAESTDLIAGTVLLDRANNNTRFHAPSLCAVCGVERRDNSDVRLAARQFVDRFGTHEIVAGVDRFTERRRTNSHQSGSDFSLFVNRAQFLNGTIYPVITPSNANGGGTFIRWNPILVEARGNELRTDSAFVNDTWSPSPRWSVSLGARFDRNHAADADGTIASNDRKLSPRLGVQFDPRGDGRQRVSASFAEYASRVADGIASSNQSSGNAASIDFAYLGPAINNGALTVPMDEAIRRVFDYFNTTQGGTNNRAAGNLRANGTRTIPGYATYFDGTLASPSVREMTVGYGAQLGRSGFARVDVIRRDWRDFYAASVTTATRKTGTPLGIPVDLSLIRNSSNLQRRYRGVLLQARWSPRRFDLGAHYTWSTLRGNDEGESATAGAIANVDPSLFYPEFFRYDRVAPIGYLQGDQRHRLRAWAGREFGPLGVSLLHSYDSGLAYSMAGAINLTRYAGAPANPGYASIPNGIYYFSGRGALRTSGAHSTDLALRYHVTLFGAELFAQGDLLNMFNNAAIIDPQRLGTTVSTAATVTTLQPFNPATETPVEGVHYQRAANFGQPLNDLAYQRPRTYRFSLGLRF